MYERWKARALLSHRLNVFVVLPQSEDILKDTLKPFCFASALCSRSLPTYKKQKHQSLGGRSSRRNCRFLRHLMKYE